MPSLRKRGDKWYVRLTVGRDAKGRRKQVEVATGKTTRHEAEAEAAVIVARAQQGTMPSTDRTTVSEWLERWLADVVRPSLAPATVRSYEGAVKNHLSPMLGGIPLRDLHPSDLARLYASRARTLAPKHVLYLHRLMHRSLGVAVRWGLVPRNVADAVDAPRARAAERPTLTADEAAALLDAARADRLYALYWLALETGLREGELVGRRWADFDEKGRTLAVGSQLQRVYGEGIVERPTKARRPRSRVPLSAAAVRVLKAHRGRQDDERALAGSAWDGSGWIFCFEDGRPIEPGYVGKHFKRLRKRLELPEGMRFHDLRHTSATLGVAHGEPLESVASRLGHASRATTLTMYGHATPPMEQAAAEKRGGLLERPNRTDEPNKEGTA
ncbi:MAG: site-specific integrase [Chloroflexota bacterium]|nr:site-specific integrase [Chloroflexota bacterium]